MEETVHARLRFLFPELAGSYLTPGADLLVMEGRRAVAEAHILSVDQ